MRAPMTVKVGVPLLARSMLSGDDGVTVRQLRCQSAMTLKDIGQRAGQVRFERRFLLFLRLATASVRTRRTRSFRCRGPGSYPAFR